MAEEGVPSLYDISDLSVLGLFDGVKIFNLVKERARQTAQAASEFDADAVILIDSWGFMLRVAWAVRELNPNIKLIKFVGPQVFATRPGRANVLAEAVDHLLGIHPFDPEYFEPVGLPTTFVGNPALENLETGDGTSFRKRHGLSGDDPILLILFGSRKSEIERLADPFSKTIRALKKSNPELKFITVLASAQAELTRQIIKEQEDLQDLIQVEENERADAFTAADLALACSGTVTTELSAYGVPTIAAYRMGWISWAVARFFLMKARFISLVNISADEELIGEFVQTRAKASLMAPALQRLIKDDDLRSKLSQRLIEETRSMRGKSMAPSDRAAEAVLSLTQKAD